RGAALVRDRPRGRVHGARRANRATGAGGASAPRERVGGPAHHAGPPLVAGRPLRPAGRRARGPPGGAPPTGGLPPRAPPPPPGARAVRRGPAGGPPPHPPPRPPPRRAGPG